MQKINFYKLFLLAFLLVASSHLSAHTGGHYHSNDGSVLKTWQLKNGQTIQGNFSMGKGNEMILEGYDGKMVVIPVSSLSVKDQEAANLILKKYQEINHGNTFSLNEPDNEKEPGRYSNFIVGIILSAITLLLCVKVWEVFKESQQTKKKFLHLALLAPLFFVMVYACKKNAESATTTVSATIPKTTTGFLDSAFNPYKPAVTTSFGTTYFYVSSNGIPAHNMMVGITNWQQQVPIPQFYTGTNSWSIPLQPVYAATPLSTKTNLMKGAVALAVNGIPIFNALNNRGEDSYLIGELDNWGGHCGKADDYHYHAAPMHLATTNNLPIAFALDGFAVYGAKEPDGSTMASLDTCHGHIYNNSVYHYHGTTNYPYVIGAMKGVVTTDPATPAPENQILPQAFASPLRPATNPLNGASITGYASTGTNTYKLTYKRGTKFGYVDYSWNATNKYTFVLTDTAGTAVTSTYQR